MWWSQRNASQCGSWSRTRRRRRSSSYSEMHGSLWSPPAQPRGSMYAPAKSYYPDITAKRFASRFSSFLFIISPWSDQIEKKKKCPPCKIGHCRWYRRNFSFWSSLILFFFFFRSSGGGRNSFTQHAARQYPSNVAPPRFTTAWKRKRRKIRKRQGRRRRCCLPFCLGRFFGPSRRLFYCFLTAGTIRFFRVWRIHSIA